MMQTLSLITKTNENDFFVTNKRGQLEGSGKLLRSYLRLPRGMWDKGSSLNIMLIAPRLIALYLPQFLNCKGFEFTVELSSL